MITIDVSELEAVTEALGLDLSVVFKEDLEMPRLAEYRGVEEDPDRLVDPHVIYVNSGTFADVEQANYVAHHELGHCLQAERVARATDYEPGAFFTAYDAQMMNAGFEREEDDKGVARYRLDEENVNLYNATPFEMEANFIASRNAPLYRVVTAIDREGS